MDGFEGKLTTSKYATLAKCSEDTALLGIRTLLERGIVIVEGLDLSEISPGDYAFCCFE